MRDTVESKTKDWGKKRREKKRKADGAKKERSWRKKKAEKEGTQRQNLSSRLTKGEVISLSLPYCFHLNHSRARLCQTEPTEFHQSLQNSQFYDKKPEVPQTLNTSPELYKLTSIHLTFSPKIYFIVLQYNELKVQCVLEWCKSLGGRNFTECIYYINYYFFILCV